MIRIPDPEAYRIRTQSRADDADISLAGAANFVGKAPTVPSILRAFAPGYDDKYNAIVLYAPRVFNTSRLCRTICDHHHLRLKHQIGDDRS
jgi:hypothetical protein